jgi:hypothetical protein
MASRSVQVPCPVCSEPVTWRVWSEMYGQDADGHRGVLIDDAEPVEDCPNRCNWTDGQYGEAADEAIKEYRNR